MLFISLSGDVHPYRQLVPEAFPGITRLSLKLICEHVACPAGRLTWFTSESCFETFESNLIGCVNPSGFANRPFLRNRVMETVCPFRISSTFDLCQRFLEHDVGTLFWPFTRGRWPRNRSHGHFTHARWPTGHDCNGPSVPPASQNPSESTGQSPRSCLSFLRFQNCPMTAPQAILDTVSWSLIRP